MPCIIFFLTHRKQLTSILHVTFYLITSQFTNNFDECLKSLFCEFIVEKHTVSYVSQLHAQ